VPARRDPPSRRRILHRRRAPISEVPGQADLTGASRPARGCPALGITTTALTLPDVPPTDVALRDEARPGSTHAEGYVLRLRLLMGVPFDT